jgi:hypothetical protein
VTLACRGLATLRSFGGLSNKAARIFGEMAVSYQESTISFQSSRFEGAQRDSVVGENLIGTQLQHVVLLLSYIGGSTMTEMEWNASSDPVVMLQHIYGEWSSRRRRLCAIAFHRIIEGNISENYIPRIVMLAEQHVDHVNLSFPDDPAISTQMHIVSRSQEFGYVPRLLEDQHLESLLQISGQIAHYVTTSTLSSLTWSRPRIMAAQANVIRDLAGNPFSKTPFDPLFRTTNTIDLAEAIYESQDFNQMTHLADALIDAGCDDPAILDHCFCCNRHYLGCWLLDQLRDKN